MVKNNIPPGSESVHDLFPLVLDARAVNFSPSDSDFPPRWPSGNHDVFFIGEKKWLTLNVGFVYSWDLIVGEGSFALV